jgi:predicted site-specific integrase-resolvase
MLRNRASQKAKSDHVFGHARKPAKMFRAGLYARVSTNDQQTLAMQNRAMREYAARRCWTITLQVREVNSGAAKREAREKLLEAARRREIDVVLVWRLDPGAVPSQTCSPPSRNWNIWTWAVSR